MKYRKLRIAWSVVWGIACLLLIVVWVRSYFWVNNIVKLSRSTQVWGVASGEGVLTIFWHQGFDAERRDSWMFKNISKAELDKAKEKFKDTGGETTIPTRKMGLTGEGAFLFPFWLLVLITGTITTLPWLRYRFSIRTLLIGMTVAAIGLGIFVASR